MQIRVERYLDTGKATFGLLFVDGAFECHSLEDPHQDEKKPGITRIPAGRYLCTLRDEGSMTNQYAAKFPETHRGMLWLRDVPDFEWVYFHIGNRPAHSEGCILVADSADPTQNFAGHSTVAYERLYRRVVEAAADGNLRVAIVDRDRQD